MTTYSTKYSNLNDLTKKEKKDRVNTFPWNAPNSTLNVDWCGQRVSKQDIGANIKFCPLCDQPMIVRIMILPCEHVLCYSCTKPESESCYICETPITSSVRIADKQKLFECDFPDCFRFYESLDKLAMHKYTLHGQQVGFDPNLLKGDSMMGNQRFTSMPMQPMGMMNMPMMNMPNMQNMQNMPNMPMMNMMNMPNMPNMMNPNFNMYSQDKPNI